MRFSPLALRIPWSIVAAAVLLMGMGCLGIARSEVLSEGSGRALYQQIVWIGLAVGSMLLMATVPNYRVLCRCSYAALAVAVVLLVAVYFAPAINGAHRWLRLGPVGIQPSELTKVALIMALARWMMHRDNCTRLAALAVPLGITLGLMGLILREPDLGTSLVLLPVLFSMLLVAGARPGHLAVVALLGLLAIPLLWTEMSREQKSRVTAVLTPTGPQDRQDDDHFHLHKAKQTLAVGGFWGSWLRERSGVHLAAVSDPGRFLVPATATDSIICVICERYGLWGLGLIFVLYAVLVSRLLAVALRTQEPYGRLLCVGVVAMLAAQVLINTSMMVGLMPITGLSLPLVSYGGSGLVTVSLALGLVLNVSLRPGYEITGEPFLMLDRRRAA